MKKVKFIKSGTRAPYFLGYAPGQIAELNPKLVEDLLKDKIVELVQDNSRNRKRSSDPKRSKAVGQGTNNA